MVLPKIPELHAFISAEIQHVLESSETATLALGEHLYAIVAKAEDFIQQLQGSIGSLGSTGEGSVKHVLDLQSAATDAFVNGLSQVTSENAAIADRVIETTDDVSQAAKSVSDVASQARMLCFNTKIEAGRLGDLGRPFMVIANQMRELSDAIAASNDRISELTSDLSPLLDEIKTSVHGLHGTTTNFTQQHQAHRENISGVSLKLQKTTAETLASGDKNLAEIIGRSAKSLEALQSQDVISQQLRKILSAIHAEGDPSSLPEQFQHVGFVSDELVASDEGLLAGEMEMF